MEIRRFVPPDDAINALDGIAVAALPEQVARIHRNLEKWGDAFPATAAFGRMTESAKNWKQKEKQPVAPSTMKR